MTITRDEVQAALDGATEGPWQFKDRRVFNPSGNPGARTWAVATVSREQDGPLIAMASDIAREYLRLLDKVEAALDRLAASQFTNAEHRQAITILEATKPEAET